MDFYSARALILSQQQEPSDRSFSKKTSGKPRRWSLPKFLSKSVKALPFLNLGG